MNWNGITMLTVIKKCEPSPYEITGNNGQINKGFANSKLQSFKM